MKVGWRGNPSSQSADVGDYSLWVGWSSRQGEGYIWNIRTHGAPPVLSGNGPTLEGAKSRCVEAMYKRLSDFYGAIITEETELWPHDYQSRDW